MFSNGDWEYPSHLTRVCSTYMMQQQLHKSSNNRQWIFFSGPNSLGILLQVAGILQSWPWHLCRSRVALKSWLCLVVSTDLILHLVSCFSFLWCLDFWVAIHLDWSIAIIWGFEQCSCWRCSANCWIEECSVVARLSNTVCCKFYIHLCIGAKLKVKLAECWAPLDEWYLPPKSKGQADCN